MIRLGRCREALTDLTALIGDKSEDFGPYELSRRGSRRVGRAREGTARSARRRSRCFPKMRMRSTTGPGTWRSVPAHGAILRVLSPWLDEPSRWHQISRMYRNTLGVALYRAGRYAEAVDVLERSLAKKVGTVDGFDLFFLAMAYHDLGHPGHARTCFDQAVRWGNAKKGTDAEVCSVVDRLPRRGRSLAGRPRRRPPGRCVRTSLVRMRSRRRPSIVMPAAQSERFESSIAFPHAHFFKSLCRPSPFRQLLLYGVAQVGSSNWRGRPALPHPRR